MIYLAKLTIGLQSFTKKPLVITKKKSCGLAIVSAAVLLLSGCATTQSLTPQQCQANNWQDIGYTDGQRGRSADQFGRYVDNCVSVVGATPNRILWEQGRQQGLKS